MPQVTDNTYMPDHTEVDSGDFPKRAIGDKLIVSNEYVVVQQIAEALCPCPSRLYVKDFDTGREWWVDNNNFYSWY